MPRHSSSRRRWRKPLFPLAQRRVTATAASAGSDRGAPAPASGPAPPRRRSTTAAAPPPRRGPANPASPTPAEGAGRPARQSRPAAVHDGKCSLAAATERGGEERAGGKKLQLPAAPAARLVCLRARGSGFASLSLWVWFYLRCILSGSRVSPSGPPVPSCPAFPRDGGTGSASGRPAVIGVTRRLGLRKPEEGQGGGGEGWAKALTAPLNGCSLPAG